MSERAPKKRGALRRWSRRLGLALLALVAILLGVLHSSWGKGLVRSRVEAAIQKRVKGEVSLASLDYGFLFSSLEIDGLVIVDAQGNEAIAVDELSVSLDRMASIGGTITIDELGIRGVRVNSYSGEDRRSNLHGLFLKQEGQRARPLKIRSIRIEGVSVDASSLQAGRVELREGQLKGEFERGDITRLQVELLSADFEVHRVEGLDIRGSIEEKGLFLERRPDSLVAKLEPMESQVLLTRKGGEPVPTRVGWGGGELEFMRGRLKASLSELALGPLSIAAVDADLGIEAGQLIGQQDASISSLRLDDAQLATLVEQDIPVQHAEAKLSLSGKPEALALTGDISTDQGDIGIKARVDLSDLTRPRYELLTESEVSIDALPAMTAQRERFRPLLPDSVRLSLQGEGDPTRGGHMTLRLQGGRQHPLLGDHQLDLRARLDDKRLQVESLNLKMLGAELDVGGGMSRGEERDVDASVKLRGNAAEVLVRLQDMGFRVPPGLRLPEQLEVDVALRGNLDEAVTVELRPSTTPLARGRVTVQGKGRFVAGEEGLILESAEGRMSLARLSTVALARMARRPAKLDARVSGSVHLKHDGKRPRIRHDLRVRLAEQPVELRARGTLAGQRWKGELRGLLLEGEGREVLRVDAQIPLRKDNKIRKRGPWRAKGEIRELGLDQLLAYLPEERRARIRELVSDGRVALSFDLAGSMARPKGRVHLSALATPTRLAEPVELTFEAEAQRLAGGAVSVEPSLRIALPEREDMELALEGRLEAKNLAALRKSAAVDLSLSSGELDVAELLELAGVRNEKVSSLGARATVELHAKGTVNDPRLSGTVEFDGIENRAGESLGVQLAVEGGRQIGRATLTLGAAEPLELELRGEKSGEVVEIDARLRAQEIDVSSLIPKVVDVDLPVEATLASDLALAARVALGTAPTLESLTSSGALRLQAAKLPLPESKRSIEGLGLSLEGRGDAFGLHVDAKESDVAEKARSIALDAQAALALGQAIPLRDAELRIEAHKWLLFGGKLGMIDAPRAELDADLRVAATLDGEIPELALEIEQLHYFEPDREKFTHIFESAAPGGDLYFLDENRVPEGKLAAPRSPDAPPPVAPGPKPLTLPPVHVRATIPNFIKVVKGPFKLALRGEVDFPLHEPERATLDLDFHPTDSNIALFGKEYSYRSADIELAGVPRANFLFGRKVPLDIQRRVAREQVGDEVFILVRALGGGPQISFSGAGNEDMNDALAIMHTGGPRGYAEPDLATSGAVYAPVGLMPLMIAFIDGNIPRLTLLDRYRAVSSAPDSVFAYGQVRRFEGEKHLGDEGLTRLRLVARPPQVGRSTSEVQLNRVLSESSSMTLGVGLRAGSRLGGGAAVYWEWASAD